MKQHVRVGFAVSTSLETRTKNTQGTKSGIGHPFTWRNSNLCTTFKQIPQNFIIDFEEVCTASHGREAFVGLSLRCDNALQATKPPSPVQINSTH
jgi:hypothetical protein